MAWLLAIWLVFGSAFAGVLSEGADAFDDGQLDDAIAVWQPASDSGMATGRLNFNLGNAWYRKGDVPRAIAYYRAAQRARPRDGDVHHNLALSRSEVSGAPPPVLASWSWMSVFSAGELAAIGLLLMLWVAWASRRSETVDARVLAVGMSLAAALLAVAWLGSQSATVGVVIERDAIVRDTPRTDGAELARLVPGAEVSIVRTLGDFQLIEDGAGDRGWVTRASLLCP